MKAMKRRALVLSSEAAGHPFRRSLPEHVLRVPVLWEEVSGGLSQARPAVLFGGLAADGGAGAEEERANARAAQVWKLTGGDWQRFLAAYCLAFFAIFTFIA